MNPALSFRMAYRHVRAGFGRAVLSVLALALGVALVVAIDLMNGAVLDSFLDTVDGMAGRAALTVTAGEGLTFDEHLVEEIRKIPGVTLAVPLVTGVTFPDDDTGELLTVHGVDVANDAAVRVYHRGDTSALVEDTIEFLNSRDSVIVGREFAERRGLAVGQAIRLVTPTGVKEFRIKGLLDPEGLAKTLSGRLVVMDLYAAQLAFAARGRINQIDLLVNDAGVSTVREAVSRVLPEGLTVEEPRLRRDIVKRTMAGFQTMLTAFALFGVLAGLVICYSRLAAIFEARTWEIGILRAVGLRRLSIFEELLKESAVLGIVGTLLGLVMGQGLGRYALPVVAKATALNSRLPMPTTLVSFGAREMWVGLLVGLGTAVLAAALPALRLAKTQPVAALTMRGREARSAGGRHGSVLAAMLFLTACLLVVVQLTSRVVAIGNVTTVVVGIFACVASAPLVRRASVPLTLTWERLFGPAGKFAAGDVTQRARGASLTIATLGVGLGAALTFAVLAYSFERTLVAVLGRRISADLVVNSAFTSGGYVGAPISDTVVNRIKALRGVAAAVGEEQRDISYRGAAVVLNAYDPPCFLDTRVCEWSLEVGALANAKERVASGSAVLVSSSFAHMFRVHAGDYVQLESPGGPLEVEVAGVTNGQPATAIILSRVVYAAKWADSLVAWVHVATDNNTERVESEIRRVLGPEYRLQVRSSDILIEYFASQARQAFRALYVMQGVIFVLVVVGVGDMLATSVLERTRALGMMRAIGLRRGHLFSMVLLEGSAIACLGLLLAIAIGVGLGVFWVRVQFPALLGWVLELHFPYLFVVSAAGSALALCLVASLPPAMYAARISINTALRSD